MSKQYRASAAGAFNLVRPGITVQAKISDDSPVAAAGKHIDVHLDDDTIERIICYLLERPEWDTRLREITGMADKLRAEAQQEVLPAGRAVMLGPMYFGSTLWTELRQLRQEQEAGET